MDTRIGIIGGSGFIGTVLTKRLLDSGYEVRIIDKNSSDRYHDLWIYADVRETESLKKSLKGCDVLINLAAEHSDNVKPKSIYHQVNVEGAKNVCKIAQELNITRIIFTSSVAVYGFTKRDTDESGELKPFNQYGQTKLQAESIYKNWYESGFGKLLVIVRPTVVFGENNSGNVYNLMRQLAMRKFLLIGKGDNIKSMAYVENVAAFLEYLISFSKGIFTFNYVDKPDFKMNELVELISRHFGINHINNIRIPYWLGLLAGLLVDAFSAITGKQFAVSMIRIRKLCQNTQFSSSKSSSIEFKAPFSLEEGIEKMITSEFKSFF